MREKWELGFFIRLGPAGWSGSAFSTIWARTTGIFRVLQQDKQEKRECGCACEVKQCFFHAFHPNPKWIPAE
jgi:hypothetical protein